MRFPQTEPEIAALALVVTQGLGQAAEDLPAPPVPASELQAKLDAYNATLATTVVAETAFREQHAAKDEALEDLIDGVKADLRYAEVVMRDQPEKLSRLGWGPRRGSSALEPPGETRDISIVTEGDTWVILRWLGLGFNSRRAFYEEMQEASSGHAAGACRAQMNRVASSASPHDRATLANTQIHASTGSSTVSKTWREDHAARNLLPSSLMHR